MGRVRLGQTTSDIGSFVSGTLMKTIAILLTLSSHYYWYSALAVLCSPEPWGDAFSFEMQIFEYICFQ